MTKSIKVHPKKRRGRPATGKDPLVSARMSSPLIAKVEAWASANNTTRSEAFRRLVELGLNASVPERSSKKPGQKARAQELATNAIAGMQDPSAAPEEKAQRRRRLTKGPVEFREDRLDLPKAKTK